MKILLDHCVDRHLKKYLETHEVKTAYEMGWADYTNGKLLAAAGSDFDVMITIDKNIKHQQNLDALPVSIIVLKAKSNRLEDLAVLIPKVEEVFANFVHKKFFEVEES